MNVFTTEYLGRIPSGVLGKEEISALVPLNTDSMGDVLDVAQQQEPPNRELLAIIASVCLTKVQFAEPTSGDRASYISEFQELGERALDSLATSEQSIVGPAEISGSVPPRKDPDLAIKELLS